MEHSDSGGLSTVDLVAPATLANPHGYFAELVERAPVLWSEVHRAWLVTRYEDVLGAYRNAAIGSDRIGPYMQALPAEAGERLRAMFDLLNRWLVFISPPDHTRLRGLVHKSFTPRRVRMLRGKVERIALELTTAMRTRLDGGESEVDLVDEFCVPLPGRVIADMFGVPEEDGDRLRYWAEELGLFINGSTKNSGRDHRVAQAMQEFEAYLEELIARYRRRPAENILSGLVAAKELDDALTDRELVATSMLILDAGYKTVQNALGNALAQLLDSPPDYRRLMADLALVPTAVEECLRLEGPSRLSVRRATEDLELGGHRISKGSRIYLVQAAANRDPRRFSEPQSLRIDRAENPHLSFGMGIHFCLGAALARMELTGALTVFLQQMPRLELALPAGSLRRHRLLLLNGLERVPVRLASGGSPVSKGAAAHDD
ncbi:MAG: cytochrome P450 [Actinophytocola sp.]|uniref:cytochrome P450 n=1 Tax=Actinophytocola sp. TaxID=1872138 RepID=UPI0013259237|nr:cytochrome P450 [Actinophytocola sp.]MPZ83200.1 cytochrome P450 [Actinophytocola sp.]